MTLGCFNFKKVIFRNYADHAETVSSKLVDFQKTRFDDPKRSRDNKLKNGGFGGGTSTRA